jgi:hypothetical protein
VNVLASNSALYITWDTGDDAAFGGSIQMILTMAAA